MPSQSMIRRVRIREVGLKIWGHRRQHPRVERGSGLMIEVDRIADSHLSTEPYPQALAERGAIADRQEASGGSLQF